jgi:uncharacterized protein (DUF736 family)
MTSPPAHPEVAIPAFQSSPNSQEVRRRGREFPRIRLTIPNFRARSGARLAFARSRPGASARLTFVRRRSATFPLRPNTEIAGWAQPSFRIIVECAANGKPLGLHVTKLNLAARLYARLGFLKTGEDEMYNQMRWDPGVKSEYSGPVRSLERRAGPRGVRSYQMW